MSGESSSEGSGLTLRHPMHARWRSYHRLIGTHPRHPCYLDLATSARTREGGVEEIDRCRIIGHPTCVGCPSPTIGVEPSCPLRVALAKAATVQAKSEVTRRRGSMRISRLRL